jgi:beta-galactosidase
MAALAAAAAGTAPLLVAGPAGASDAAATIDDLLIMTSVRNQRLTLRVDYQLSSAASGAKLVVGVHEADGTDGGPGGTAGLPAETFSLADTSAGTHRQTFELNWAHPHLWDVEAPYLYWLTLEIQDGTGAALSDEPATRFGFREVWTEGRELILNGHPLKLRQMPFVGDVPSVLFYVGMGMNAFELQPSPGGWRTYPPGPALTAQSGTKEMFDLADEKGLIVMMPTVTAAYDNAAIGAGDQTVIDRWMGQVREANKLWDKKNRPSIIAWMPEMNQINWLTNPRYSEDPETVGRSLALAQTPPWATVAEQQLKAEDPSRLVVFHECGQTSDIHFANVYLNLLPMQEREDFLSRWAEDGDLPFGAAEFGTPTTGPFFRNRFEHNNLSGALPYFTEFFAEYLGDAAYAAETDQYIADLDASHTYAGADPVGYGGTFQAVGGIDNIGTTTAYFEYVTPFIRNVYKSWRAWGANAGWHPWLQDVGFGQFPGWTHKVNRWTGWPGTSLPGGDDLLERPDWANPLYDAHHESLQALTVYLGGPADEFTAKAAAFRSGESAERTIIAIWDGAGTKTVRARWQLKAGNRVVASGRETFHLQPGTVQRRPIRFRVPRVSRLTDVRLVLDAQDLSTPNGGHR